MRRVLWGLLIGFAIVLSACTSVDDATFDHYAKKAEQIIFLIHDESYDEVVELFSDDLRKELDAKELREIRPLLDESGAYESIKKVMVDETEEITTKEKIIVTVTSVAYEHKNRTYTLSFNDEDELVGFYIK